MVKFFLLSPRSGPSDDASNTRVPDTREVVSCTLGEWSGKRAGETPLSGTLFAYFRFCLGLLPDRVHEGSLQVSKGLGVRQTVRNPPPHSGRRSKS